MKYRISVYNASRQMRELIWETFTSKKKAQEFAEKLNAASKTINAVVIKVK